MPVGSDLGAPQGAGPPPHPGTDSACLSAPFSLAHPSPGLTKERLSPAERPPWQPRLSLDRAKEGLWTPVAQSPAGTRLWATWPLVAHPKDGSTNCSCSPATHRGTHLSEHPSSKQPQTHHPVPSTHQSWLLPPLQLHLQRLQGSPCSASSPVLHPTLLPLKLLPSFLTRRH